MADKTSGQAYCPCCKVVIIFAPVLGRSKKERATCPVCNTLYERDPTTTAHEAAEPSHPDKGFFDGW